MVTKPDADAGSSAASEEHKMLSAKVTRTLEIRTDTPAMKAALDALANLPNQQDELHSIDSRSIRVAIEQDALQQAMLLQNELSSVLSKVVALRKNISDTTAVAKLVSDAINTSVVQAEKESPLRAGNVAGGTPAQAPAKMDSDAHRGIEHEKKLAASLSTSFQHLNNAKQRVETVNAFLDRYNLSEEDARLLDHYDFEDVEASGVNGNAFLNALERIQHIRNELSKSFGSGSLLQSNGKGQSGESLGTSSALMMMETLAQKQEQAYERLYHWLQSFLQLKSNSGGGSDMNSGEVQEDRLDELLSHPFVKRSLSVLREQPAFYSYLLELVASSRRSVESRRFLLALTSGYDGSPPIEMRAHDAVAYTADMLAFCFRAYSVEAEVARGLFDTESETDSGEENAEESKTDNYQDSEFVADKPFTAVEMLNHSMSGVARPLQARIQQVISNLSRRPDEGDDDDDDDFMDDDDDGGGGSIRTRLSQLYDICGMLLFYISALSKIETRLQPSEPKKAEGSNAIVNSMLECLSEAMNAYEASLRVYCAMLEQLTVVGGDSEAALCHAMFSQLVQVRDASPGFSEDVECPPNFESTLSLQWACQTLVEAALPTCKILDDTVCLRQSLAIARRAGISIDVSHALHEQVNVKEQALIETLVNGETDTVLEMCGLGSVVKSWKQFMSTHIEGMSMSSHPGLSGDELEMAVKEFYESLYAPPIPSFESTIKDPGLRKLARAKIAEKVCTNYGDLYEAAKNVANGYEDLTFLVHTPDQVETLMSV